MASAIVSLDGKLSPFVVLVFSGGCAVVEAPKNIASKHTAVMEILTIADPPEVAIRKLGRSKRGRQPHAQSEDSQR